VEKLAADGPYYGSSKRCDNSCACSVPHVQVVDDGSTDADTRPKPPTNFSLACKLKKVDHAR